MTAEQDAKDLGEITSELAVIDLPSITAAAIGRRARQDLGLTPSVWRFVEPVLAIVVTGGYLGWVLSKVVEALG